MSKLRSEMDEMELLLDQWDILKSELHNFGNLNREFAEYGAIAHKGYIVNDPSYLINLCRNTVNRLSACMKLAAYTLAGQLAMLPAEKCKWTAQKYTLNELFKTDEVFETECKGIYWLEGTKQHTRYCIYCGKEIEFYLEEPEDDEPEAA